MIKLSGNLRRDFEKATAENVKLKDRILDYQEEIKSLQSSHKRLEKSNTSQKIEYENTIAQKDAVIKEQNRSFGGYRRSRWHEYRHPYIRYSDS